MKLNILAASKAEQWGVGGDYNTIRRIEEFIIPARATIIQRRYDQAKVFPQSLLTTIPVDFIQVDESECVCLVPGKKAIRTKYKLPKPIIARKQTYFSYFGESNKRVSFSYLHPEELELASERRFSDNEVFYTYFNDYGYVVNAPSLKHGAIRYVVEDPIETMKHYPECECSCIEDGEFAIEQSLVEAIDSLLEQRRPALLKPSEEIKIND